MARYTFAGKPRTAVLEMKREKVSNRPSSLRRLGSSDAPAINPVLPESKARLRPVKIQIQYHNITLLEISALGAVVRNRFRVDVDELAAVPRDRRELRAERLRRVETVGVANDETNVGEVEWRGVCDFCGG